MEDLTRKSVAVFDRPFTVPGFGETLRLVMKADGVSEAHLRHLYSGHRTPQSDRDILDLKPVSQAARDVSSVQVAENEGMPPRTK